jgi:hypothetical protein
MKDDFEVSGRKDESLVLNLTDLALVHVFSQICDLGGLAHPLIVSFNLE